MQWLDEGKVFKVILWHKSACRMPWHSEITTALGQKIRARNPTNPPKPDYWRTCDFQD